MSEKAFITNTDIKTLRTRIHKLIEHSEELKFLVGFFYFSGWKELYKALKDRDDISIKVLVGLSVDKHLGRMVELPSYYSNQTNQEKAEEFIESLGNALNDEQFDIKEFYQQVEFFIRLLEDGKLQIRKTAEPNHSKLYLFKIKEKLKGISDCKFITGSSNLTRAGILEQNEFNVEISDYGTEQAENYFDRLWSTGVKITEDDRRRRDIIDIIRNRTQAAEVSPFEAYALVLKNYIEVQEQKQIKPKVQRLLKEKGYETYRYQLDAVNQALTIVENYNGVIIADVVGLGKSIIAGLVAKNLNQRGMIICPPGIMGDKNAKSGWRKYKHDFELYNWEIRSCGDLENIEEYLEKQGDDIEVVIVDEAHRFRNEDTENYEMLSNICRNRKVILMTATPFNNSPADILSMLKLFIVTGKSTITLDDNLEARFSYYNYLFQRLSFISKNYSSKDPGKRNRAENYYEKIFGSLPVNLSKVKGRSSILAAQIRAVIEPITIRRNRLDLKNDPYYKKEITQISECAPPKELFYELTPKQSEFYDKVINDYFGEDGEFGGTIYQPFIYEEKRNLDKLDEKGNRVYQQQRNLYDFMRRLLVKRFESSFGAFKQTIGTFVKIHKCVKKFIKNSNGKYILDRSLIEKIYNKEEDEIQKALDEFAKKLQELNVPKTNKVYNLNSDEFEGNEDFKADIDRDLKLLKKVRNEINKLELTKKDPKITSLISKVSSILSAKPAKDEPKRKVVIFTEYLDTVKHLKEPLEKEFKGRVLTISSNLTAGNVERLRTNFDASIDTTEQEDNYDILLTSDKISEGFDLNRAGVIINYDIPWNPTRVVQRVGRINRIGKKVFNQLYIYNFFPTEKGSDIVKSRQIASQKMFLIHNTLGEDAKIFDIDEQPNPSELFTRINMNPDEAEDESLLTKLRIKYNKIRKDYPDLIKRIGKLPARVKTAKSFKQNQLHVFQRKKLGIFLQSVMDTKAEQVEFQEPLIEDILPCIECKKSEPALKLSDRFWNSYEKAKSYRRRYKVPRSELSLEVKAQNCLQSALKNFKSELQDYVPFIRTLLQDLREYNTLSKYTLRRLTISDLKSDCSQKELNAFIRELKILRNKLGEDYLEIVKQRLGDIKSEVIIAIENISESN